MAVSLNEYIFFICCLFFFAVHCKFFCCLPIHLHVQGRQRFKAATTGQEFPVSSLLSGDACKLVGANVTCQTPVAHNEVASWGDVSHFYGPVSYLLGQGRLAAGDEMRIAMRRPRLSQVCRTGRRRSSLWATAHVIDSIRTVFPSRRGSLR